LPGILEVTGDMSKGTLIVRYDSALVTQEQIVEVIENLGYAVEGTFEP
jgi:copper chaperone CopZ